MREYLSPGWTRLLLTRLGDLTMNLNFLCSALFSALALVMALSSQLHAQNNDPGLELMHTPEQANAIRQRMEKTPIDHAKVNQVLNSIAGKIAAQKPNLIGSATLEVNPFSIWIYKSVTFKLLAETKIFKNINLFVNMGHFKIPYLSLLEDRSFSFGFSFDIDTFKELKSIVTLRYPTAKAANDFVQRSFNDGACKILTTDYRKADPSEISVGDISMAVFCSIETSAIRAKSFKEFLQIARPQLGVAQWLINRMLRKSQDELSGGWMPNSMMVELDVDIRDGWDIPFVSPNRLSVASSFHAPEIGKFSLGLKIYKDSISGDFSFSFNEWILKKLQDSAESVLDSDLTYYQIMSRIQNMTEKDQDSLARDLSEGIQAVPDMLDRDLLP